MTDNNYWNNFAQSGTVEAYLAYKSHDRFLNGGASGVTHTAGNGVITAPNMIDNKKG